MATVSFDRVSKTFNTRRGVVRAVDDLSIEIADRELVVLVGPSGCGKSTTLRLLAGLEEPSSGTIRMDGSVVDGIEPKDRDIAMVFQSYALYPHMTVFGNMAFGLKMRKVPGDEIRRQVLETARMLGIEQLLDRKPRALSGGERQRVALGRAVVRRPRVFLFDEPLSNLDAGLRTRMRTEIRTLQRQFATTCIYVTHDQEEAMTLGDRLVIMKEGTVQQCGTPLEIYDAPVSRFVAGFFGAPPMNFIEGRIQQDAGEIRFVSDGVRIRLSPRCAGAIETQPDGRIVMGVRAENLTLVDPGLPDPPPGATGDAGGSQRYGRASEFEATVEAVEPLGDRQNTHLITAGGEKLVARTAPTASIAVGRKVKVALDPERLHLFEPGADGRRLA